MNTQTQRTKRSTTLIAIGSLVTLIGLAALIGGSVLVGVHTSKRDHAGFYSSGANSIGTPTHAFVSEVLDVGTDGGWLLRKGRLATVRVTATGTKQKPVFVGLARAAQVKAYLRGVAYDEITDFDLDPFTTKRTRHIGATSPPAPVDEHFWARSSSGSGRQAIRWPLRSGNWRVIVMNADGSADIQTQVAVAAKVPLVLWLGIGLLAAGVAFAVGGAFAIYRGGFPPQSSGSELRLGTEPRHSET